MRLRGALRGDVRGIREFDAHGAWAGKWRTVQFLIRCCAWHMLDHAWEMEDRDQSGGS